MKQIVLGKGFLGQTFESYGYNVFDKNQFNFTGNIKEFDKLNDYDVIINCIGKSNTRWCELPENREEVLLSNFILPKELSNYCNKNNKKFVHMSTGCLYDNTETENKETDFIAAHCFYTLSKWLGESACNKNTDLILRARLYFGSKINKNNLLCKIKNFKTFTYDKYDSFTSVELIVDATKILLDNNQTGIFNIAHEGCLTMKELATILHISGNEISADALRKREKIYLVNNIMSIHKLKQFYQPSHIISAVKEYNKLLFDNLL